MSAVSKAQNEKRRAQAELDATVAELSARLDPKRKPVPWIIAGVAVVGLIAGGIVFATRGR